MRTPKQTDFHHFFLYLDMSCYRLQLFVHVWMVFSRERNCVTTGNSKNFQAVTPVFFIVVTRHNNNLTIKERAFTRFPKRLKISL